MKSFIVRLNDDREKTVLATKHESACKKAFSAGRGWHWEECDKEDLQMDATVTAEIGGEIAYFYRYDNG